MSSRRVNAATEIMAGQWINKESMMRDGICGYAVMVVKASGQRVYHTNRHGEDEGNYCARKSVVFVSDTQNEAMALHTISREQDSELTAAVKSIKAKHAERINARIEVPTPAPNGAAANPASVLREKGDQQ